MKQLSGQDASFLYLESHGAHLHLTALYVYEQSKKPGERLGYPEIVNHIESRLDSSPLFRQKLVRPLLDFDYPYWVDDADFELDEHLHRHSDVTPKTRRELFNIVAKLHAIPLDLSRPPWEMHIFERLGPIEGLPKNCFAVIAKYHHAAIDGASGSQLVDGLHDTQPIAINDVDQQPWIAQPEPGTAELLARGVVNNIRGPLNLIKTLAGAAPALVLSRLSAVHGDTKEPSPVPKTCFNTAVSPLRVFHAMSVDLQTVRDIRTAVPGATVNDVILTICGGALRAWLEARGELPEESLVAMVPVNARTSDQKSLGGNKLATMFVPIHTDLADPLDRLEAVREATHEAKSANGVMSPEQMSEITSQIPAITLSTAGQVMTRLGIGHRMSPIGNCTITNVPGPPVTLYLGPARLVWSTGTAPLVDGMGLIISAFSYENQITFSFCSCPEMVPDMEFMAECTTRSFDSLKKIARMAASNKNVQRS